MNVKSKIKTRNIQKNTLFASLMCILLTSLLICTSMPNVEGQDSIHVETETQLKEAVNNAPLGVSVVIAFDKDIVLTTSLVIFANKDITLTSNNNSVDFFSLCGASGMSTVIVNNGGVLKLDGVIVIHTSGEYGTGITVNVGGALYLYSGEISGNDADGGSGGGVYNSGAFFMFDGKIAANKAGYGGGVYNAGANALFTMSGGEISGNKAIQGDPYTSGFGGGVCSWQGAVVMNGGVISGNTANFGGGVFNYLYSTCVMSGNALIANNVLEFGYRSGGGVYNYGSFTLYDEASISSNSAPWGGGVFNEYGSFTMEGGFISGNEATVGNGGGIYANNVQDPNAKIAILGGTISDNITPSYGGGIYVAYGGLDKLTVAAGVVFSGNSANGMYSRDPVDDALYIAQISSDVTWTAPATQGYNNYDISYNKGERLTIYTVTVQNSYASLTGAGDYFAGDPITVYAGNRVGYRFTSWTINAGGISLTNSATATFTMPENNVVITANWQEIIEEEASYTVTYNDNSYTSGTVPIDRNSPYAEGALVTVLGQGSMVRDNFVFLGWSLSPTATVAAFTADSTFTIQSDTILYAVWDEVTYTVTYQSGTHGTFNTQITSGLHYGDPTPTAPTVTGETGWTFTGWLPIPTLTVTGNAIYIAQWKQETTPTQSPNPTASPSSTTSPIPTPSLSPTTTPSLSSTPTPAVPYVESEGKWAVVNLILSVIGVVLAVLVLVRALLLKRKKDTAEVDKKHFNNSPVGYNDPNSDDTEKFTQCRLLWLMATVVLAVVGIVVFLLTEDMSLLMGWVDKWTIVNAAILIVELVVILFVFKQTSIKSEQKQTPSSSNKPLQ